MVSESDSCCKLSSCIIVNTESITSVCCPVAIPYSKRILTISYIVPVYCSWQYNKSYFCSSSVEGYLIWIRNYATFWEDEYFSKNRNQGLDKYRFEIICTY